MKRYVLFTALILVIGITVFTLFKQVDRTTNDVINSSLIDTPTLEALQKKDASGIDISHLAKGLTPPTNKWFSGIALQKIPQTVFPTPLSFTPSDTSFSFALPKVQATNNTLFAAAQNKTTFTFADATHYEVTRYDELSVELTYSSATQKLATVTLAAGSPYIYVYALSQASILIEADGSEADATSDRVTLHGSSRKTVVAGFDGSSFAKNDTKVTATLPVGSLVTAYGRIDSSENDPLFEYAHNRITNAVVSYKKDADSYRTSLRFTTSNGQKTYYGALPHQSTEAQAVFTYDTLYGKQQMILDDALVFTTPTIAIKESLDVANIRGEERELLVTTLRRDINATQITAEDSYFGSKEMYRSAQLLDLAEQIGEKAIAMSVREKLRKELMTWLAPMDSRTKKSFYYDTKIQGLVGETVAFGSQEFNDHHFHYGYFIYAASILAKYDAEFLQQYKDSVNVIVADIANYRSDEPLPLRRSFDAYFGHSWASGSAPFADGNNQESISEAINAWVAVGLWAEQIKDVHLETEAEWMLSNEAQSSADYWMNIPTSEVPYNQGYGHSLVSLNWGGKRDYATFFSADKHAILGILLIPMNPTMVYQASYGDRISQHVSETIERGEYNVQFGDYILMYEALRSKAGVLDKAKALLDKNIDGANSRSYLYAWIMSRP